MHQYQNTSSQFGNYNLHFDQVLFLSQLRNSSLNDFTKYGILSITCKRIYNVQLIVIRICHHVCVWCAVGAGRAPAGRRSSSRLPTCGLQQAPRRSGTRWRHGSGRRTQPTSCRCSSSLALAQHASTCKICPHRSASFAGVRASLIIPWPSQTHWGNSGMPSSTPELWRWTTPLGTMSLRILRTYSLTTMWNRVLPTLILWWKILANLKMVSSKKNYPVIMTKWMNEVKEKVVDLFFTSLLFC